MHTHALTPPRRIMSHDRHLIFSIQTHGTATTHPYTGDTMESSMAPLLSYWERGVGRVQRS